MVVLAYGLRGFGPVVLDSDNKTEHHVKEHVVEQDCSVMNLSIDWSTDENRALVI